MNSKKRIFLTCMLVTAFIIQFALLNFMDRYSSRLNVITEEMTTLEEETEKFKHFEDSLAGNENFRQRLADSVQSFAELKEFRKNQRIDLINRYKKFNDKYPDQEQTLLMHRILLGANTLTMLLIVCLTLYIIIQSIKRR